MPELPEVQSSVNALEPEILQAAIKDVIVRNAKLREPVPANLRESIIDSVIVSIHRRAKYIIISLNNKQLIIHLGMSGSLTLVSKKDPVKKHSHVDIVLDSGFILRYNDPRKFGMILLETNYLDNKYIKNCGIEPFSKEFKNDYLYNLSRNKKMPIKTFLMKNSIVVGIGNIYASECLFKAAIRPDTPAKLISKAKYSLLSDIIVDTLKKSIDFGGTTLKDHQVGNNISGQNQNHLLVYGKTTCSVCNGPIETVLLNNRNTFYCPNCQKSENSMKKQTIENAIKLLEEHAQSIRESSTIPFDYAYDTFDNEESKKDYDDHIETIKELKSLLEDID
jgi:formamidopyrimidine-DNA glycosylase